MCQHHNRMAFYSHERKACHQGNMATTAPKISAKNTSWSGFEWFAMALSLVKV
jgi:hypothetical protein